MWISAWIVEFHQGERISLWNSQQIALHYSGDSQYHISLLNLHKEIDYSADWWNGTICHIVDLSSSQYHHAHTRSIIIHLVVTLTIKLSNTTSSSGSESVNARVSLRYVYRFSSWFNFTFTSKRIEYAWAAEETYLGSSQAAWQNWSRFRVYMFSYLKCIHSQACSEYYPPSLLVHVYFITPSHNLLIPKKREFIQNSIDILLLRLIWIESSTLTSANKIIS